MPNVKITEIPQVLSVQDADDFYIKTGDAFCRVPVSSLIALVESGAATILNMTLTGSTVTLNMTPAALIELCSSQKKVYFMLGNIAFTVSGVDGANNMVKLFAIADGVSYEVTLAQTSSTTMGGTLVSKHLSVNPEVVTLTGTTPVIAEAQDNTIYEAGELTSLTIQSIATGASFIVRFSSPAGTATALTLPSGVYMPSGFTVEPYGRCEINVVDNFALAAFWPFDE